MTKRTGSFEKKYLGKWFLLKARFIVQIILFVHCHMEFLSRPGEIQRSMSTQTGDITRIMSKHKLFSTELSTRHAYVLDYVINCKEYTGQSDFESNTAV